jgi:hypothetical protein
MLDRTVRRVIDVFSRHLTSVTICIQENYILHHVKLPPGQIFPRRTSLWEMRQFSAEEIRKTISWIADHSAHAVWGMNRLRLLGVESPWRHGCLSTFILLSYVGSGLATGWSPAQGALATVCKIKKLKWNEVCQRMPNAPEGATGIWMNEYPGLLVVGKCRD